MVTDDGLVAQLVDCAPQRVVFADDETHRGQAVQLRSEPPRHRRWWQGLGKRAEDSIEVRRLGKALRDALVR